MLSSDAQASTGGRGPAMVSFSNLEAFCSAIVGKTIQGALAARQSPPPLKPPLKPATLKDCVRAGVCPVYAEHVDCTQLSNAVRFELKRQANWECVLRVLARYAPPVLSLCQSATRAYARSKNRASEFTTHGTIVRVACKPGEDTFRVTDRGLISLMTHLGADVVSADDGSCRVIWDKLPFACDSPLKLRSDAVRPALAMLSARYGQRFEIQEMTADEREHTVFLNGLFDISRSEGDLMFTVVTSVDGGELSSSHRRATTDLLTFMRRWQPSVEHFFDDDLILAELMMTAPVNWVALGVKSASPVVEDSTPETVEPEDTAAPSIPEEIHECIAAPALATVAESPASEVEDISLKEVEISAVAEAPSDGVRDSGHCGRETSFRGCGHADGPEWLPRLVSDEDGEDSVPQPESDGDRCRACCQPPGTAGFGGLPRHVQEDLKASVCDFIADVRKFKPWHERAHALVLPVTAPSPAGVGASLGEVARGRLIGGHMAHHDVGGLPTQLMEDLATASTPDELVAPLAALGLFPDSPGAEMIDCNRSGIPVEVLEHSMSVIVAGVLDAYGVGGVPCGREAWCGRAPKGRISWYRETCASQRDYYACAPSFLKFRQMGRDMCASTYICDGDCNECPWGDEKPPRHVTEMRENGDDACWGVPDRWGGTSGWQRIPVRIHEGPINTTIAPLEIIRCGNRARRERGWANLVPMDVLTGFDGTTYAEILRMGKVRDKVYLAYVDAVDVDGDDVEKYLVEGMCVDITPQILGLDDD